jgi:hypothetical protein
MKQRSTHYEEEDTNANTIIEAEEITKTTADVVAVVVAEIIITMMINNDIKKVITTVRDHAAQAMDAKRAEKTDNVVEAAAKAKIANNSKRNKANARDPDHDHVAQAESQKSEN